MAGREGGSSYERLAADYIASQLKQLKIKPLFKKSYLQEFKFEYDSQTFSSQNVAGIINNKADSTIIIISHYDHIGYGGKLSKSYGLHKIHPGADDNCSGVAANLLLAKKLRKNKDYNYIFLFTGAHEKGLFGAIAFIEENEIILSKILLVINLDMVGRLDESSKTMIFETKNFVLPPDTLANYSDEYISFQIKENLVGDQTKFASLGIKTIIISSGIHNDYHKITDTSEKTNTKGISCLVNTIVSYLHVLNKNRNYKL
jgi:Zn-dependent M28 family amino/carboxypeptidase